MTYTVDRYSSNLFDSATISFPLSVAEQTIDSSSTTLNLLGRGVTNYGELHIENLIHLLENFAGINAPGKPITGQTWWKQDPTNSIAPQQMSVWNGAIWKSLSGATSSLIAPTGPSVGDLWYDMSMSELKYWDGTEWVKIYSSVTTPTNPGPTPPTPPSGPTKGDLWYNDADDIMFYYDGTNWIPFINGDPNPSPTSNTSISFDILDGNEVIIFKVDGNITNIMCPATVLFANLWDGTTPVDKPDLRTLYPNGINPGNNFSTMPGNGITGNGSQMYGDWTVAAGGTLSLTSADIAERYHADEELDPGTVVMLGGLNEITKTKQKGEVNVFGVISSKPAICLNQNAGTDETHPYVVSTGRAPIKVIGRVEKGQRLVASEIEGVARAFDSSEVTNNFEAVMSIIGRALSSTTKEGQSYVEVAIGSK